MCVRSSHFGSLTRSLRSLPRSPSSPFFLLFQLRCARSSATSPPRSHRPAWHTRNDRRGDTCNIHTGHVQHFGRRHMQNTIRSLIDTHARACVIIMLSAVLFLRSCCCVLLLCVVAWLRPVVIGHCALHCVSQQSEDEQRNSGQVACDQTTGEREHNTQKEREHEEAARGTNRQTRSQRERERIVSLFVCVSSSFRSPRVDASFVVRSVVGVAGRVVRATSVERQRHHIKRRCIPARGYSTRSDIGGERQRTRQRWKGAFDGVQHRAAMPD